MVKKDKKFVVTTTIPNMPKQTFSERTTTITKARQIVKRNAKCYPDARFSVRKRVAVGKLKKVF